MLKSILAGLFMAALSPPFLSAEIADEPDWEALDRQYRASYFYAASQAATNQGHHAESLMLLKRAADADPLSQFLLRELAESQEAFEQQAEAAETLKKALALDPKNIDVRQKLARLLLRAGKAGEARELFLLEKGAEPTDKLGLRSLAAMDLAQEDYEGAKKRLEKLLALFPEAEEERELYASVLARLGEKDPAVAQYERLLKKDPKRHETAWRLSRLFEESKQNDKALDALENGLKASPGQEMLLDAKARLLFRLEQYDKAEAAFSELLKVDAKDREGLLYRGMSRLQAKKFPAAQEDFLMLGELEQGNPTQAYGLGLAFLWQGKHEEAEKAFKGLIESHPRAIPGYTQLAFLYDRAGKPAKALEVLEQGLKANPGAGELYLLLGTAQMDAKAYAKAEKIFLEGLKKTDSKNALRFQLAVLYDKDGKFPKAEGELKKLIEEEPEHAQALNYLGYSWVDRDLHLPEAEALIRRALKVEPENHYYLDSLGWACFKQDKLEEARLALEKAVAAPNPSSEEAVVFEHLGKVYEKLGKADLAKKQFERAHELKKPDAP